MPRVTLQTIADRVGVSRMTVSNAFSRPDQLSSELRQRILSAADELGYVGPDPAARALARGRTGAVGVLLTDSLRDAFSDEVATTFLGAIADELEPRRLALTLLSSATRRHRPGPRRAEDGAFVYSCDRTRRRRVAVDAASYPSCSSTTRPVDGAPSITSTIARSAGCREHIVQLGHRRIGILTASYTTTRTASSPTHLGSRGTRHHAADAGLARRPRGRRHPAGCRATPEQRGALRIRRRSVAARRRRATDRPAVLSDAIAAGAVRAADSLGLHVPGDVSIGGFDDSPARRANTAALTTVRQDVEAKGRIATSVLSPRSKGSARRHDKARTCAVANRARHP